MRIISKTFKLSLGCMLFMVCIFILGISGKASNVEEIKSRWYIDRDYPVLIGSNDWGMYDFAEMVDILNPPEDLLMELTSQELSDLLLKYPYYCNMSGYDDISYFFDFMENYCYIYCELLDREDGVKELLNTFRANEVDINNINEKPEIVVSDQKVLFELFVCRFIKLHRNELDEKDLAYFCEIAEGKKNKYAMITNGDVSIYLLSELSMDEDAEERHNVNDKRRIEPIGFRTEYFEDSGTDYSQLMNGVTAYYNVGYYHKFNTCCDCREWYDGDFSPTLKNQMNMNMSSTYPTWSYLYTATTKYNCHSYAWILANPTNGYWLISPETFATSSAFSCVGQYSSEPLNLAVNDRVVIYGYTNNVFGPKHSLIVVNPNYQGTLIMESKIGYNGVFRAKYEDMMTYFAGTYIKVYRAN